MTDKEKFGEHSGRGTCLGPHLWQALWLRTRSSFDIAGMCFTVRERAAMGWIHLPWKDGHQKKPERESVNTAPAGTPGTDPSWGLWDQISRSWQGWKESSPRFAKLEQIRNSLLIRHLFSQARSGRQWGELAGTGGGRKKVQFLHYVPNCEIILSQRGNLSCSLAGKQFMPDSLSGRFIGLY